MKSAAISAAFSFVTALGEFCSPASNTYSSVPPSLAAPRYRNNSTKVDASTGDEVEAAGSTFEEGISNVSETRQSQASDLLCQLCSRLDNAKRRARDVA